MKFIPKIIPKKEKQNSFAVVDIGLGRVSIAVFNQTEEGAKFIGVGRRSFTTADTILDATLEATDALGAIVDELPRRAVIGICGGGLEAVTTIAKYKREKPKTPIDSQEINNVLEKIASHEREDLKVFFSTVTGAKIDQARITNPIGVKGESTEIDCFVAFKPEEEMAIYDQIIEELEFKPVKVVPSSFAVATMVEEKVGSNMLLLRVGKEKTETTHLHGGHVVGVHTFDIGETELEFYNFALEAILERQDEKERSGGFWLYADSDDVDLEKVAKKLKETDWKKKFKLDKDFEVKQAEGEENFSSADMGLLALSLQE